MNLNGMQAAIFVDDILPCRGILHDPEIYTDPLSFIPERYFDVNGNFDESKVDPVKYIFGYGRR